MFHAFITKATKAHQTFTELLETFQEQEDGQKGDTEVSLMDPVEDIDDSDEYVTEEDIKRELIVNDSSENTSLIRILADTQVDSSGSADENAGEQDQESQENQENEENQENQENNGKYLKTDRKDKNDPICHMRFSQIQYSSDFRRLQRRVFGPRVH